ncbi:MAG: hypothetical protein KTR35_21525, partial [Gammaproteobacteria bacterium]|nr:hypothetical protein [Gammaproteobacteria bacterium]
PRLACTQSRGKVELFGIENRTFQSKYTINLYVLYKTTLFITVLSSLNMYALQKVESKTICS